MTGGGTLAANPTRMRHYCWHRHALFFRGRLHVLAQLRRFPMVATLTLDQRLVAILTAAMLEQPSPAVDERLRDVVHTLARELVAQGASPGTTHGTIESQVWAVCCELSRWRTESGPRCGRIRDQVGEWIGELWPGGILPRTCGR